MSVGACRVAAIFENAGAQALFEEYERECANPLLGATRPDRAHYEKLEAAGVAQCFAVYDGELLHGFAVVLLGPVPHYGRRFANVESLFVTAAGRSSGQGVLLMNAMEAYARASGCAELFYTAPVKSRLARLLFLSADLYPLTNYVFMRKLA